MSSWDCLDGRVTCLTLNGLVVGSSWCLYINKYGTKVLRHNLGSQRKYNTEILVEDLPEVEYQVVSPYYVKSVKKGNEVTVIGEEEDQDTDGRLESEKKE